MILRTAALVTDSNTDMTVRAGNITLYRLNSLRKGCDK